MGVICIPLLFGTAQAHFLQVDPRCLVKSTAVVDLPEGAIQDLRQPSSSSRMRTWCCWAASILSIASLQQAASRLRQTPSPLKPASPPTSRTIRPDDPVPPQFLIQIVRFIVRFGILLVCGAHAAFSAVENLCRAHRSTFVIFINDSLGLSLPLSLSFSFSFSFSASFSFPSQLPFLSLSSKHCPCSCPL